ncbi:MAG: ABC transporter permease [Mycoplasmataceae bacterium]|nr:ABC transporter permease [Mycoplasmataceae bacterium]
MSPQTLLAYVMVIFGAIISIAIFKDYRDDGTELILVTKPINRTKTTIAKFMLFFSFSFAFALITLINAPITFIFKDVTAAQVSGLTLSLLFSNFTILITYGMLATFVSLFANKIWTILGNVIVVVLLSIISTVNALVIKTPAALAKKDGYAIVSVQYLSNDEKFRSFAALTPTIEMGEDMLPTISFTTIEQEKAKWNEYMNSSVNGIFNFFDFSGQLTLLNNMGALQDELTKYVSQTFGGNRFYDYYLQNHILEENDNALPSYFVQMPNSFSSIGKFDPSEEGTLEKIIERYFTLMSDQSIVMLGSSQVDTSSLLSSIIPKNFYVAKGNNGWSGTNKNIINYEYDDLKPNDSQKEVFDKILNAIWEGDYSDGVTSHNKLYDFGGDLQLITQYLNNPTVDLNNDGSDVLFNIWNPNFTHDEDILLDGQSSFINVLDKDSLKKCNGTNAVPNFIHACLVGANKGLTELNGDITTNGKYKNKFWDCSLTSSKASEGLMKTMAMFKLYVFKELTKFIENKNLYKYANDTKLELYGYNFNSQPILPLMPDDGKYPIGYSYDSIDLVILSTIAPTANYDLKENYGFDWPPNIGWANGITTSSYFTDPDVLRARVLLEWATATQEYGYSNAVDSGLVDDGDPIVAFDRDKNYNVNLLTTSTNFPLIYECLGATYTTHSKMESWQIILLWVLIASVLTSLSFTIYIRADFK